MTTDPLILALKARREAAGWSQEKAASMIGITSKTYARIERGETDIKMSHYRKLLDQLKVTSLDITLDMMSVDPATPWDVAAAARTLPPEARTVLVSLIMILYRTKMVDD
ncbi:helix-turn-helix domain-containing protein [Vibrio furnissii]|uniref:helix-turn-helix domain-containing protein n=1 Tax=Vibrio furnissii TaxID=29494 RepID=UPI001EEC5543|nr:helix-turn-helix transcriptional regulator [Vibrio furnissii]MCG6268277.1 helix-turn-helix transcriptional regulator [Vibrio furnissii]